MSNYTEGKHYVIGDLHGQFGTYKDAISVLEEDDELFVLGDVIDRGEYGIHILLDMMDRDNVHLLLGNHEWSFLKCFEIIKKYDLTLYESFLEARLYTIKERLKEGSIDESEYKACRAKLEELFLSEAGITPKDIPYEDAAELSLWCGKNGGSKTLEFFMGLDSDIQEDIYEYVSNASIMEFLNINNQKQCLVHAAPFDNPEFMKAIQRSDIGEGRIHVRYNKEGILSDSKIRREVMRKCTERRVKNFGDKQSDPFYLYSKMGFETIYGHEPQDDGKIVKNNENNSICIDVRKGAILLCIETGRIQKIERSYFERTGKISSPYDPGTTEEHETR